MESPFMSSDSYPEPPRTVERRRRGRGVDVMAFPTPERAREHHAHFPTPVTEHRASKRAHALDMLAPPEPQAGQLPTPQTLPRKRKSHDSDGITPLSPPSPTGHTTFFLSQSMTAVEAAPEKEKVTPRRRPGLLFAQQMGLTSDSSTKTSTVKFGARLGVGVGMGGGMRGPSYGSADKVMLDNPFLDPSSRAHGVGPQTTITTKLPIILRHPPEPSTPDAQTSYVPQLLRPDAERSLSPTTAALRRKRRVSPPAVLVSSATIEETMAQRRAERLRKLEEDNPFIAKPGEVVRPRPTSEDRPLVTYVFRGAKKVFANPFIPPDAPYAPAQLDPSHPEYEVHPCPPPRLLWPTSEQGRARTISSSSSSGSTPRASRSHLDDDDDMDVDRGPLTDEEFVPEGEDDGDSSDEEDLLPAPRRGLLFSSTPRAAKHDLDMDETPVDGPAAHVKRRRLSRAEL